MSLQASPLPSDLTLPLMKSVAADKDSLAKIHLLPVNGLTEAAKKDIDALAFELETNHLKNACFARAAINAAAGFSRKNTSSSAPDHRRNECIPGHGLR